MLRSLSNKLTWTINLISKFTFLFLVIIGLTFAYKIAKQEITTLNQSKKYLASKEKDANPSIIQVKPLLAPLYVPLIAIGSESRTNCSAFVISTNYALTAAHCVEIGEEYTVFALRSDTGEFVELKNTKATAMSSYFRAGLDMAALHGDFRDFERFAVINNVNQILTDKVMSLGILQQEMVAQGLTLESPYYFGIAASGQVFPGMSGGPVIDENGVVIGINSAMAQSFAIISPLHMWKHYLNIE